MPVPSASILTLVLAALLAIGGCARERDSSTAEESRERTADAGGAICAASGARYEAGDTLFWDHDGSALVEVAGQRFTDCRMSPSIAP